jgi:hypothetical protein
MKVMEVLLEKGIHVPSRSRLLLSSCPTPWYWKIISLLRSKGRAMKRAELAGFSLSMMLSAYSNRDTQMY